MVKPRMRYTMSKKMALHFAAEQQLQYSTIWSMELFWSPSIKTSQNTSEPKTSLKPHSKKKKYYSKKFTIASKTICKLLLTFSRCSLGELKSQKPLKSCEIAKIALPPLH